MLDPDEEPYVYPEPKADEYGVLELSEVPLSGMYCRADCLLDARERGWPFWRIQGVGG